MNKTKLKGNLTLLLTAIIWGTSFIAQSIGMESISPTSFIGIRCILGATVLVPVILIIDSIKKKKGEEVQPINKTLITGGVICGVVLFIASYLQTAGLVYTSPGKSGFITALYMVFIPIAGLFMGKKLSPIVPVCVVIAVLGMYLLCIDSSFTVNRGDVLTLICALFFTAHIMVIDKFSPQVDGVKLSCIQFYVCGVLGLISMFFDTPEFEVSSIIACWRPIAYSGIMSCGIAYTLQIVGQKYTDPTSASIIMSLESVVATLSTVVLVAIGWDLTGGALTMREIMGCVLMFVAIMLVQLIDIKKEKVE